MNPVVQLLNKCIKDNRKPRTIQSGHTHWEVVILTEDGEVRHLTSAKSQEELDGWIAEANRIVKTRAWDNTTHGRR